MTVEARAQRVLYQGNGTAVEFPFDFAVYAANQVRVVTADAFGNETERAHGAEFSVRLGAGGVGGYAGGTVVYPLSGAPLAPGEKIAVLSAVPSTQDKSFPNNTPYFQEQIEGGLDKATRLIQQLEADVARSIKVPPTSAESPEDMGAELLGARDEAVAAAESAGSALVGAEAARDAASGEVDRAAREADRARDEADRAAQAAQLGAGAANLEAVWTLAEAVAAGESLDLPVTYFPGRNMLHLSYDGVELYRGPQYEEIGEPGADALVFGRADAHSPGPGHGECAPGPSPPTWPAMWKRRGRRPKRRRIGPGNPPALQEEAARDAAVSKTVAQNAAVNAGEDAERADKAAADAEKAALVAQAAERGQGIYTVRRADCLPHCPEGFYIVDPRRSGGHGQPAPGAGGTRRGHSGGRRLLLSPPFLRASSPKSPTTRTGTLKHAAADVEAGCAATFNQGARQWLWATTSACPCIRKSAKTCIKCWWKPARIRC